MAFTHCTECDWSQDDFWDFSILKKYGRTWLGMGYNPISMLFDYIKMYWKPQYHEFDKHMAEQKGWPSHIVHSWYLLWYEIKRLPTKFSRQHWWTYEDYKDSDRRCPKCGSRTVVD